MSVGAVSQSINLTQPGLTLVLGENLDLGGNGNRNGVGKCLRGSTSVEVNFPDPDVERKFKEFLKKQKKL